MKKLFSLKGLFCMMATALVVGFSSCEKDNNAENVKPVDNMELFFIESKGLPETSIDSVKSFASKFEGYVKANPKSTNSEYYNPTVENMSYAASVFGYELTVVKTGILLETDWLPDTLIHF